MAGLVAAFALAQLAAASPQGEAAQQGYDESQGAPLNASAYSLTVESDQTRPPLQTVSADALLGSSALRVADASRPALAASLRARDWRGSRVALSETSRLSVSIYDPADPRLPLNGINAGAPLTAAELAATPNALTPSVAINYEKDLVRFSGGDYDFSLSPRAVYSQGPDGSVAGAGAIARIGQNLEKKREDEPSWYFFAGADAEALTIDPRQGFDFSDSMRLQGQTIVGDAQAGVAWNWGPADVALAYVQKDREYSSPSYGISRKDDFAALSVSLRR
ncbi:lipid A-modifier LpxR family protein [Euryhalocaulis caribicus]|uniref:lipid A-modifier LpxR family protein n=1 Tax=Euryhalocaulis caribicus TaxID=1161401 RepID=UPI00039CBFD4|nr:lipid A-modifier LpxR family protein [Euryhalocaulis caribicus]